MDDLYKLNEGCSFFPYDGLQHETSFIVRSPDNRHFKVSSLARELLLSLDGRTTLEEISSKLNARCVSVSADELRTLVSTKYHPLGIVEDTARPGRTGELKPMSLPFLLHWDLIAAKHVGAVARCLQFMFSRPAVVPGLLLTVVAHYVVYFGYSRPEFLSHAGFLWVLMLSLLSVLWHEFGHASAVARYGGSPGKIGFGLFVLLPSFYADVSEIWRFPRRQRMTVDLAGVYFQEVFFVGSAVMGVFTSAPEYFVVCRFIDLMVLLTLNPVFQFDGYWFLADWLALPNLYRLALGHLVGSVRRLFNRDRAQSTLRHSMSRRAYVVFVVYAAVCNVFLAGVAWLSYRYLYSTFAKVHIILPAVFASMIFAFKTHDLALLINKFLTLFFVVAFPATALTGISRYARLLARYALRKYQDVRLARGYRHPEVPRASS